MLNRSGESGHPCLVSDFRGNAFNFSPLRIIFAEGLSYIAFIMLRYVPSIPAFWRVFNHKWMLNFVKGFLYLSFFLMLSFKPAFSLSSFTSIKGSLIPFHFLPLKWYHLHLSLLIFLSEILIPACESSSLAFHIMYSA